MTKSHFWPDRHIVITMLNFKVVARANLWVYDAENLCVTFFNQFASIFHLRGGEIKKNWPTFRLPIFPTSRG